MVDTASLNWDGKPLGGVAQVAIQQGRYAGRLIATGRSRPSPFRYFDKGTMSVVGQGQTGNPHLKGLPACLAWAAVHIAFPGADRSPPERAPAVGLDISRTRDRPA